MSKSAHALGLSLPMAWEKSLKLLWKLGDNVPTEYDKEGDPPSKDIAMTIHVMEPFMEPRIHRCMPGGIEDLAVYTLEVVDGIHDDWIAPNKGKWSYTYHDRFFNYGNYGPAFSDEMQQGYNQIQYIINTLAEEPRSRRAQAIIWDPVYDGQMYVEHPPCLQRIWCRINHGRLDMHVHMRSNDAFQAAFMNMYAFTELQKVITDEINKKTGGNLKTGSYIHMVDSYHIYGSKFEQFEGFLQSLRDRPYMQRVYWTPDVQYIFDEVKQKHLGN